MNKGKMKGRKGRREEEKEKGRGKGKERKEEERKGETGVRGSQERNCILHLTGLTKSG